MILETYRECLQDVLDLPGLTDLLTKLHRRELSLVEVDTPTASPFASSLLFDYVATYMYEGDTPNAERRAAALSLDRDLLRELLGQDELRELIDPDALQTRSTTTSSTARSARAPRRATSSPTCCAAWATSRVAEVAERVHEPALDARRWLTGLPTSGAPCGCASAARSAGSRPTTPASTATRSAPCRPAGCPRRSWPTCPMRCAASSLATRARTSRSPPRSCATATASTSSAVLAALEAEGDLVRGELRPGGSGEREWCDPDVLRRLRRASLAALRKEIEPADQRALAAFAPSWQGVDRHAAAGAGRDRLREVLVPLQGLALPADVWERDVLPRRTGAYSPTWLDELCASGEVVWVGAGALGRSSGKVALYFREDAEAIGPAAAARRRRAGRARARPAARASRPLAVLLHRPAGRGRPRARGPAGGALGPRLGRRGHQRRVGAAARPAPDAGPRAARDARAPRPRHPRASAPRRGSTQPTMQGRWSLTSSIFRSEPDPRAQRRTVAELLLERHGILTRETVLAEGIPGGFSALYDALTDLETLGVCRRGYFVEGLGGAQFALPGAVERLRARRDDESAPPLVLAATDPAQPYGAALPWPKRDGEHRRPSRVAGAYVVLVGAEPAVYVERGGRGLTLLVAPRRPAAAARAHGAGRVHHGRPRPQALARAHRRRAGRRLTGRGAARRARVPLRAAEADAQRVARSASSRTPRGTGG